MEWGFTCASSFSPSLNTFNYAYNYKRHKRFWIWVIIPLLNNYKTSFLVFYKFSYNAVDSDEYRILELVSLYSHKLFYLIVTTNKVL